MTDDLEAKAAEAWAAYVAARHTLSAARRAADEPAVDAAVYAVGDAWDAYEAAAKAAREVTT